ncbi:hypothetical protein QJQ45_002106 [Haematococcus lacustris]|nr:hypothetical protein QJQ45_002106 [Haematococcus lacustris]
MAVLADPDGLDDEVDERQPYAHKYKAADALLQAMEGSDDTLSRAMLNAKRGLLLLETDLLKDGEDCVQAALPVLSSHVGRACPCANNKDPASSTASQDQACSEQETGTLCKLQQDCYNSLAVLWCSRGDHAAALSWLKKAEEVYKQHLGCNPATASNTSTDIPRADTMQAIHMQSLEAGYTSTLFYLAQVHGHADNRDQSARYCAATLQRQLAAGSFDVSEWLQNCVQLANYYSSTHAFALAEHCIAAAHCVQLRQQRVSHTGPPSGMEQVAPEVEANLHMAAAKLAMARLAASHAAYIAGQLPLDLPYPDPSHFPSLLCFPSLANDMPSLTALHWGVAALAQDFATARTIFNAGMVEYNMALAYYQLDGWVTEHVHTLMDVSNMFRLLAAFESEPHRQAAMHKQRVQRLQPVSGSALNKEHYLGLVRSIELELGAAWRDVMDAVAQGKDSKQSSKAALAAATHYTAYLDSYKHSATASLPARIDEDNEVIFLTASFNLGRVMHRCSLGNNTPQRELDIMVGAVRHLQWVVEYVAKYNITQFRDEARLSKELSDLLLEKIKMLQRVMAVRLVPPGQVPKLGKGGSLASRQAIVHSLCHIESWAVDLSWDIIARFGAQPELAPFLPHAFFEDFVSVADDECRHFLLLEARLRALGSHYGALAAHDGTMHPFSATPSRLWESAARTAHSLPARLAVEHCVHEARGLDRLPATIDNFRRNGDEETAVLLEAVIYPEEVTHCAAGVRWLKHLFQAARDMKPDPSQLQDSEGMGTQGFQNHEWIAEACAAVTVEAWFHQLVRANFHGSLRPPFNEAARAKAGFAKSCALGRAGWTQWSCANEPDLFELQAKDKEHPKLSYKWLQDRPPKAQQRQQPAEAH